MFRSSLLSILALIAIQILFGINFSTSKVIVGKLDPLIWSNIRFLIAGIAMLVITLISKRKHPKVTKEFLINLVPLSLLGMALGQGLFLFGLKYTSTINTAIITTSIPLLTLLIVVIRRQEVLTIPKLVGFILAFVGVVGLRDLDQLNFSSTTFIGDAMVFCGALCFALYLSYGKKFLTRYDNFWVTTWMFLISGILMFFINIPKWIHFELPVMNSVLIGSAVYTIIGATLLTYLLNNWVLRNVASGQVALFIYLQPIVAGIIGWSFLNEQITSRMLLCSVLILLGLISSMLKVAVKKKAN